MHTRPMEMHKPSAFPHDRSNSGRMRVCIWQRKEQHAANPGLEPLHRQSYREHAPKERIGRTEADDLIHGEGQQAQKDEYVAQDGCEGEHNARAGLCCPAARGEEGSEPQAGGQGEEVADQAARCGLRRGVQVRGVAAVVGREHERRDEDDKNRRQSKAEGDESWRRQLVLEKRAPEQSRPQWVESNQEQGFGGTGVLRSGENRRESRRGE